MEIELAHYLTVAAILFTLGIFGIFMNRKNVIIILSPSPRSCRTSPGRFSPCSC